MKMKPRAVAATALAVVTLAAIPLINLPDDGKTYTVTLHWLEVKSPGVVGYRVYRGTELGKENKLIGTVIGPKIIWFIDWKVPVISTGNYYYRVRTFTKTAVSKKSVPMIVNGQGIPSSGR